MDFYVGLLGMEIVHNRTQDHEYLGSLEGLPDAKIKFVILKLPDNDLALSAHVIELIEYVQPKGTLVEARLCDVGHVISPLSQTIVSACTSGCQPKECRSIACEP